MVLPFSIKEIQSHLGLFQFFKGLIDKYALIAAPLSAVTSTEHPWRSHQLSGDLPKEAGDAWYKLRNIISSRPVIAFPDFSLPFQLFVDASVGKPHSDPPIRGGVGAILTQVQKGVTRPVGYFSRQFRDSKSRYNAYNAELCGLVAALDHFMTDATLKNIPQRNPRPRGVITRILTIPDIHKPWRPIQTLGNSINKSVAD